MATDRAGVLQLLVIKEEVSPEQQESSSSLDQQGREPGLLKEVKEEEEEHDVSQLSLTAVDVKTEDDEKPPTSVLQLLVIKEEVSPEQQESSSSLDQQGREPGLLKEVKEEEEEHDVSQLSLTAVDVKTEDDEKPPTSSLTPHLKTEADGDNCGGSEPASRLDTPLHPDQQRSLSSESDTDDSEDWRDASDSQSRSKGHDSEKKDGADDRSLICSCCGKKCSSKSGLTQHIKNCFGGSSTCWICGKCFENRQALNVHMTAHPSEKPFGCSQCDKHFNRKWSLQEHMKIHTGEKPFRCSQCAAILILMNAEGRPHQKDLLIERCVVAGGRGEWC
ncbi:uncharacterized protein ACB057_004446 [Neosynchiropus ocellatus]